MERGSVDEGRRNARRIVGTLHKDERRLSLGHTQIFVLFGIGQMQNGQLEG